MRHHCEDPGGGGMLPRAKSESTYLDELVPAGGDNDGVLGVGREPHARNPLGVALLGDGELAVTKGVPELDGAIAGSGDNLSVVGGERNRENIVGVSDETAGGGTGGELPETESLIPRGGKSVCTIGRDDLNRVSAQDSHIKLLHPKCNWLIYSPRVAEKRTQSETMWE